MTGRSTWVSSGRPEKAVCRVTPGNHMLDRSLNRMVVEEAAIGCERCHGPGALRRAATERLNRAGD